MRPCLWVVAVVCLFPSAVLAGEASERSNTDHEMLDRRVYLPSLLGYGVGTGALALGTSTIGFATYPTGIVSYTSQNMESGSQAAHYDSFSFNPSIDVRAGRFTIGGGLSLGYTHNSLDSASSAEWTSLEIAPRVGYLVPLVRGLLLWPRVSAGFLVAQASASNLPTSSAAGFLASADVLLVAELGRHFFLTAGPSGWFDTAASSGNSSWSFGLGASIGLGVAL